MRFAALMIAAAALAFGQSTQTATGGAATVSGSNSSSSSSLMDVQSELVDRQSLKEFMLNSDLNRLKQADESFRRKVAEYDKMLAERAALYEKLEKDVADGDPVLIKKTAWRIEMLKIRVDGEAESIKNSAVYFKRTIEELFEGDTIGEDRYIELRNYRVAALKKVDAGLTEKQRRTEEKARTIIPEHFAFFDRKR